MLHNGSRHSPAVPAVMQVLEALRLVWRAGAVSGCKPECYHSVILFCGGSLSSLVCIFSPQFSVAPERRMSGGALTPNFYTGIHYCKKKMLYIILIM